MRQLATRGYGREQDRRTARASETADGIVRSRTSSPAPAESCALGLHLAMIYCDLFDYPLTRAELSRRALSGGSVADCEKGVEELLRESIGEGGGYLFLRGREELVGVRDRRRQNARELWPEARRCAAWMGRLPFVRMVAVCGSLAVENADDDADVDLFLVVEPGRLWIAHALVMTARRLLEASARLAGRRRRFCPNYLLSLDCLELAERDLYTAHEVTQTVPLSGADVHRRFLRANGWVRSFLPQLESEPPRGRAWLAAVDADGVDCQDPSTGLLWRGVELLLSGRGGDVLDGALHRVLLAYYTRRLRALGVDAETVRRSYTRDRQEVIAQGYRPAIAERFRQRVEERLGEGLPASVLARLFPSDRSDPPVALYRELFAESYGGQQNDHGVTEPPDG